MYFFLLGIFLLFFGTTPGFATSTLVMEKGEESKNITPDAEVYIDSTGELEIKQVIDIFNGQSFPKNNKTFFKNPNYLHTYWMKVHLKYYGGPEQKFLEINNPHIDHLEIHFKVSEDEIISYYTGRNYPFSEKLIFDPKFVFVLPEKEDINEVDLYIKYKSEHTSLFSVHLLTLSKFQKKREMELFFFGAYYGIVFLVFFYNLFLFAYTRKTNYIIYLFFVVFVSLADLADNGGFYFIFYNSTELPKSLLLFAISITLTITTIMLKNFLNLGSSYKFENLLLNIAFISSLISFSIIGFFSYHFVHTALLKAATFVAIVVLISSFRPMLNKERVAIYTFFSFFILVVLSLINIFINLDILDPKFYNTNYIKIGSIIQILLFSMAISDRVNELEIKAFKIQNLMQSKIREKTYELENTVHKLEKEGQEIKSELNLALELQNKLIPSSEKIYPLISVSAYYEYLIEVGGDFYDIVQKKNGSVIVFIADASGHGIQAALLTALYKICFTNAILRYDHPVEILKDVNEQARNAIQSHNYLTAFLMSFSPEGKVQYASAGHKPGFLFRKKNNSVEALFSRGMFLGMESPQFQVEEKDLQLEKGDRILLYTDGVIDTIIQTGEKWNSDSLMNLFLKSQGGKSLENSLNFLKTEWIRLRNKSKLVDDSTLVQIEYNGESYN